MDSYSEGRKMRKVNCVSLFSLMLLSLFVCTSCASRKNHSPFPTIDQGVKARMVKPVNCASARQDIQILENEKASVGKQMLSGVRSVLPIGVVAGILMGDYRDRVSVATGQYNADLEAKIAQIRQACRVY
jgi:hypothetical protein